MTTWIMIVPVSIFFMINGYKKIQQDPTVMKMFDAVGAIPDLFTSEGFCRYVGGLELLGAVMLLISPITSFGSTILLFTMIANTFILKIDWKLSLTLIVFLLYITIKHW